MASPTHFVVSILLSKQDLAKLHLSNIELFSAHHQSSLAQAFHHHPSCFYISHDVDLSATDISIPVLKSKAVDEAEEKTTDDAGVKKKAMSMDDLTLNLHLTQEMVESSQQTTQDDSGTRAGRLNGVRPKLPLPPLEIQEKSGIGETTKKVENDKPVMHILSRSLSQVTEEARIDLKASPAAKFLLQVMPWELTPSPVTPAAAVPFLWEEAPGMPKLNPASLPSPFPTLQLPPRLLIVPTLELQQKGLSDMDSLVSTLAKPEFSSSSSSTSSNPSDLVPVEEKLNKNFQLPSPYVPTITPLTSPYRDVGPTRNELGSDGKAAVASLGLTTLIKKSPMETKWAHWIMRSKKKKKNKGVPHGSSASLLGNIEDQAGENGIIEKKPEISLNSKIAAAMDAKGSKSQEDRESSENKEEKPTIEIPPRLELVYPTRIAEPTRPGRQRRVRQKRSKWVYMKFRRTSRFFVAIFRALKRSVLPRKSSRRKLLGDSKMQYQSLH